MFNWSVDNVTEKSGLPEQLCKTCVDIAGILMTRGGE